MHLSFKRSLDTPGEIALLNDVQISAKSIVMKVIPIIALAVVGTATAAFAEDVVPYAYRPWGPNDPYAPTLGDIMATTQLRHSKLWYAGKVGNWELASYELGQIRNSLINAARLYQNIPVDEIVMINEPLSTLDNAIRGKNNEHFIKAFSDLTTKCNVCHEAAGVGFITMRVPTTSLFSDQSFELKRK